MEEQVELPRSPRPPIGYESAISALDVGGHLSLEAVLLSARDDADPVARTRLPRRAGYQFEATQLLAHQRWTRECIVVT